ncbi:MAG: cell division protein FtsZ [Myxococcota bacterium]|nr:cell division protein FtsZ [Myxococcota bacterium]MEC8381625.1 cell division protein FtsZ [Myxococcota bacterium]
MSIELVEDEPKARIRVIGVGGGGGNAVNNMIASNMTGVEFVVVNTDAQDLNRSLASQRIQLGTKITKGLGAGAKPEVGREAAREDHDKLVELVQGCDMVFIAAGMGGGTGTGAAPVIAEISKEVGALTVAVVTRPFNFEGARRRKQAERGIEELRHAVDTLITIPNQRLIAMAGENTTFSEAFEMADRVLYQAVKGVSDLINNRGMVNVDFADVCTIMSSKGIALMGVGLGSGDNRMIDAAQRAINSPLLDDVSIAGATSVLINVTGSSNIGLREVSDAMAMISEEAHEDVNTIWGMVLDESMGDEVRVTVIATGFEEGAQNLGNAYSAPSQSASFSGNYSSGNAQSARMRMSPQGGGLSRPAPEAPRIQRPNPGLSKPPQRTLPTQSQPTKRSTNPASQRNAGGQGQRSAGTIPSRNSDGIQSNPSASETRGSDARRRSKLPNVEIPDFFGDN